MRFEACDFEIEGDLELMGIGMWEKASMGGGVLKQIFSF